jgi:hypothetical protein
MRCEQQEDRQPTAFFAPEITAPVSAQQSKDAATPTNIWPTTEEPKVYGGDKLVAFAIGSFPEPSP